MDFLAQNWHWALLAVVSGGWLGVDALRARSDKTPVSPIEATMLINREDAIVVDVRNTGEFEQGHIPNSRNIPLPDLERRLGELDAFKQTPVILCCEAGSRSMSAAATLRKAGFERPHSLRGGMAEWEKAGQPVSRKKKEKHKEKTKNK